MPLEITAPRGLVIAKRPPKGRGVVQQTDHLYVAGGIEAIDDEVAAGLSWASDVEGAHAEPDLIAGAARWMHRVLPQVMQSAADECLVALLLRESPAASAVLQRAGDVPPGARRDEEPGHAPGWMSGMSPATISAR